MQLMILHPGQSPCKTKPKRNRDALIKVKYLLFIHSQCQLLRITNNMGDKAEAVTDPLLASPPPCHSITVLYLTSSFFMYCNTGRVNPALVFRCSCIARAGQGAMC